MARETGTRIATLTTRTPDGSRLDSFMISCGGCPYLSGPYVTPWLVRMIASEHEAACASRPLWGGGRP